MAAVVGRAQPPVPAGTAAVWIQVGLGLWLLAASRGTLSRLTGLASVSWGLVVWVFGESFGGILAPGLTWLTGAPGAAAVYVAAGALIALPVRAWFSPRAGQLTLAGLGLLLAVMAGLQARPGSGFWSGRTLAAMARSMAQTSQPPFLSGWVSAFAAFDEAHGFAVNLFVVVTLTAIAIAFLSGRPRLVRPALLGFTVLGLADWVLVQDLGFLGGIGTDPNSMIPFILLAASGYLALEHGPGVPAAEPHPRLADAVLRTHRPGAGTGIRSVKDFYFSERAVVLLHRDTELRSLGNVTLSGPAQARRIAGRPERERRDDRRQHGERAGPARRHAEAVDQVGRREAQVRHRVVAGDDRAAVVWAGQRLGLPQP